MSTPGPAIIAATSDVRQNEQAMSAVVWPVSGFGSEVLVRAVDDLAECTLCWITTRQLIAGPGKLRVPEEHHRGQAARVRLAPFDHGPAPLLIQLKGQGNRSRVGARQFVGQSCGSPHRMGGTRAGRWHEPDDSVPAQRDPAVDPPVSPDIRKW
jgi:hypothetical protein